MAPVHFKLAAGFFRIPLKSLGLAKILSGKRGLGAEGQTFTGAERAVATHHDRQVAFC